MKYKKSTSNIPEIDMTPMIDIVFQLLSFFMVVTNFEQTNADERVKLPKDVLAKPPIVKHATEIVVNVGFERDIAGNLKDPDPYVFYASELVRVPNFAPKFQAEARLYKEEGTKLSDVTVVIRADSEVPTGLVQELIKQAQDSKFEKFAMKATQKTD